MPTHHALPDFWSCYNKLPEDVRKLADRSFEVLKTSPRHPSLQFKKVGKLYSVRVGLSYRALATPRGDNFLWFWIGPHAEYDQMLR